MARKRSKYKKGERVRVIGNISGHGVAIGTISTITGPYGSNMYRLDGWTYNFYAQDLEFVPTSFSKGSLQKEKMCLKAQMDLLDSQLLFLEETEQEEGNIQEFRAYQTMSLFEDSNLTKWEKSKAIAK